MTEYYYCIILLLKIKINVSKSAPVCNFTPQYLTSSAKQNKTNN